MSTSRRQLLQSAALGALPVSAARRSVYEELGIAPVLNFRGTHTVIGASKLWPELHEAMAAASQSFVSIDELQDKAGERLAKLIGCEDAMVTTGTAGAITLAVCGALTGMDEVKVRQLPDLTGMRSEVIIQEVHRNGYDHAVRNTGVKIVTVESREQMESAFNARTAALYYLGGTSGDWAYETPVKLNDCLAIAHRADVPVIVDAANMLPPWSNIQQLARQGVDLICASGGKHMRGPQCSGILAGRRTLVRAARLNSSPHSDSLGRGLKVGREEVVGLLLAAEKYSKLDFDAIDRQCQEQAMFIAAELKKIAGVQVRFAPHDRTRRVHRLQVEWDTARISVDELERKLLDGSPRIAVLREGKGITFTVFMNDAGDEKHAARRMREIFAMV
jgi:uncharacterized pyridoxal phosphate-dependent enzyme